MHITLRVLSLVALTSAITSNAGESSRDASHAHWQREDISDFREYFLNVDRSFSTEARAAAEARISRLEDASESMAPSAFAVELCRIAALADNAHTQCLPRWVGRDLCEKVAAMGGAKPPWCRLQDPDFEIPDFQNVSLALMPFGEQFHVIGVQTPNADLLGSRLVAVDGKPIDRIRTMLRTFAGGTPAHRDQVAARVLASPAQLHAVGLSRDVGSVWYSFVTLGGQHIKRQLWVPPPSARPQTWHSLPTPDGSPWALQEPDKRFRFRDAPEIDSVIVQLRVVDNGDDRNIMDFLEGAESRRQESARRNVVLDMRSNGGGNFYLVREFMTRWPEQVPGHFFVLTSRETFSAAITSIAYLKQAGRSRVSIIGEPVGDRLMFFSDGLPVQLPHSGLFFLPATVRMDYHDGCRHYDDCAEGIAQTGRAVALQPLPLYSPVARLSISVATLAPDVLAPWTIESWLNGTDPAMDAVKALVVTHAK
jgi:hypothetical protein